MVINTSFPEQQEQDGIIKQSALITKYFLHKKHETFTNKERIWKFKLPGGWRVGSQRSSSRQVSPLIWRNENGGAKTLHNLSSSSWPVVEPLSSPPCNWLPSAALQHCLCGTALYSLSQPCRDVR